MIYLCWFLSVLNLSKIIFIILLLTNFFFPKTCLVQAIEEHFAPLCSILCSAMQFVSVISKDGKKVSFKTLIINKCQCLFEIDYEIQEMDSAKKMTKINFCKDPVIFITLLYKTIVNLN